MADFTRWLRRQRQLNAGGTLAINENGTPIESTGDVAVRVVGPLRITGAPDEYELMELLPIGAIVLYAWALRISLYDQPVSVLVSLREAGPSTGLGRNAVTYGNAGTEPAGNPDGAELTYQGTTTVDRQVIHAVSAVCTLMAIVSAEDVAPTTGSVDCYALIAEPSA